MDPEIEKLVQEQFANLPVVIQDVINGSNWEEKLRSIVQKHNLHVDQGADIENQTLLTMLGFETPEDYIDNLVHHADLPEEQANAVAIDVEKLIFQPIRDKLIGEEEVEEKPVPVNKPHEESPEEDTFEDEGSDAGELSRGNILNEIENPKPGIVSNKTEVAGNESAQNSESEEDVDVPNNLPIGELEDVPKHGHNHQAPIEEEEGDSVEINEPTPEPAPITEEPETQTTPDPLSEAQSAYEPMSAAEKIAEPLDVMMPPPIQEMPHTQNEQVAPAPITELAPASPASNIIQEKLSGTTVSAHEAVQHDESAPASSQGQSPQPQSAPAPKADPYREPI